MFHANIICIHFGPFFSFGFRLEVQKPHIGVSFDFFNGLPEHRERNDIRMKKVTFAAKKATNSSDKIDNQM